MIMLRTKIREPTAIKVIIIHHRTIFDPNGFLCYFHKLVSVGMLIFHDLKVEQFEFVNLYL